MKECDDSFEPEQLALWRGNRAGSKVWL